MGEDDIDVGLLHALEGALETLDDVLAGETTGVGLLAACAEENLCCEDVPDLLDQLIKIGAWRLTRLGAS